MANDYTRLAYRNAALSRKFHQGKQPMPVLYQDQRRVLDGLISQGKVKREHHALLAVFRKYAQKRYPKKPDTWREECAHSWLHQYLDDETPWQQFTDGK